jgi:hypothetical protein
MISDLNDLAAVLEEEIAVGEDLRRNLACQRQALVEWNMEALIAGIDRREMSLRSLGELEQRRLAMLRESGAADASIKLKHLIARSPDGLPGRGRLQAARRRALETFLRLQADERSLNGFMEDLLAHLREAFKPLTRPPVSVYGDDGSAAPERPASAFIRSKA